MINNDVLRIVLQNSRDFIIGLKHDFCIFIFNPSAEQFYHWEFKDIIGKNFLTLCQENGYLPPISPDFFQNPTLIETQQYVRNENGILCTINWSVLPISSDNTHNSDTVLLMGKDLRMKKNNVAHHLDKIIACTPGSLYWKDRYGHYLGCNEFMVKTAKLNTVDDIIGKKDEELWPETAENIQKNDRYVIETGKTVFLEEIIKIHDGTVMYFTGVKMPLKDENENIIGVIGNSLDITQLKKTEAELVETKEKAEEANRIKIEFIHNMEHDIRTPLSGIWGLVNQLHTRETDAFKKELLHDVTGCAQELLEYCNGILDFSKIELGVLSKIEKKFDVKKLIEEVITMEKPAALLKQLDVKIECKDDVPTILLGDDYRLKRILLNLVGNAIKFTQQGYIKILVSTVRKLNNNSVILKFTVQDSGIGIPTERQDFIYEKFTRLTPSNKGLYKGMGLGLRIVKQFIEEMGGEIELKSEAGKGSAFICTLPFKLPLAS